jgi:uncharacterized DUF497 family protein
MAKVKGVTSKTLRQEFKHLQHLSSLWTRSFFCSTAGNVSSETVQRFAQKRNNKIILTMYIQKYKHKNMKNMQTSGFQWDRGSREKCQKHGVSIEEIEFVFSHEVAVRPDEEHSQSEYRYQAIGKTEQGRQIFIFFPAPTGGGNVYSSNQRPLHAPKGGGFI